MNKMKKGKELTLQDLMQMSHDMIEVQKDFDMISEFVDADKIRTILKIVKDE
jgi:hypothetical protein